MPRPTMHEQSAASGNTPSFRPIGRGLVGYWRMEESLWDGTADEVVDLSGQGNHGQAINSATTDTGKVGRCGTFARATSDYAHVGDADSLDLTSAGTIAAWAYSTSEFPSADATVRYWGIVAKDVNGTDSGIVYDVSWDGSNATHVIKCRVGNGTAFDVIQSNTTFNSNWHFVCFRWDGAYLYLRVDNTDSTPVASTKSAQVTASGLCIGRAFAGDAFTFDGLIDEVGIWNRRLDNDEVTYLYNAGSGIAIK